MKTLWAGIVLMTGIAMNIHAAGFGEPRDVTFTSLADGTAQKYVMLLPAGFDAAQEHHVMIALHGHGSDRWQFIKADRGECSGLRDVAAKYGMIFVAPDYRANASWMGPKAEADVVQIIRELRAQNKIGKVILGGASMGGASVLTFTALHPELVDGVCSLNGTANHLEYRNFQDAIRESFGGGKTEIPLEYKLRSAEYWPERFTMPAAFTAGGQDQSVPPQSVLHLADVLSQMNRKVLLIYRPQTGHETNYADTVAAAEFVVRAALGLDQPAPAAAAPGAPAAPVPAPAPAAASGLPGQGGLFFSGQTPANLGAAGTVELGLKFQITKDGAITGFRFFKAMGESPIKHQMRLWDDKGSAILAVETANESPSGWQAVALKEPLSVKAGAIYILSYTAADKYVGTAHTFAQPIVCAGATAIEGLYTFDKLGRLPDKSYDQLSYFLDIDYSPKP